MAITKQTIALRYTIFAVVATVFNIASQDLTLRIVFGAWSLVAAVAVGTIVGLVVKYVLDLYFIFKPQQSSVKHTLNTFLLYSIMSILTTLIFWGFEFGFDALFGTKFMRYLGAVIGLAIGYMIKYQLDKRFVFCVRESV